MRHTIIILLTLCMILLQPFYAREGLLSLRGMVLLGGSTLYASSVLLVCYHLLRAPPNETKGSTTESTLTAKGNNATLTISERFCLVVGEMFPDPRTMESGHADTQGVQHETGNF